ncbi:MAG: DUF1127 domain-containing protein [Proteobacteria bacterium]|nr:DUF1127 domain-containing protein [Pseudomonadota bacterium]
MSVQQPIQMLFNSGYSRVTVNEIDVATALVLARELRSAYFHALGRRLVHAIRNRMRIAKTVRVLEALDDRTLADIGVERAYIRDYAERSFKTSERSAADVVAIPVTVARPAEQQKLSIAA